jgi:hypothetical protein
VAPQVGINMDTQAFHPADLRTLGERFGPIAGGLVMLAGTLLPWLEVHRPVPVGLYAETGLQTLSGQISFGAGVLVVVAGPPTSHSAKHDGAAPSSPPSSSSAPQQ